MNIVKMFFKRRDEQKLKELIAVARIIQDFYLDKYKDLDMETMYNNARHDILSLGITQIKTKGNTIIFVLQRPGLLIGRHGTNIDLLQKFISEKTKYLKILIEEDKIMGWLIPYTPETDYDMEMD